MNPWLFEPHGLPVPADEHVPTSASRRGREGLPGSRSEEMVFEQMPDAVHFRYPYAHGPYQVVPREMVDRAPRG